MPLKGRPLEIHRNFKRGNQSLKEGTYPQEYGRDVLDSYFPLEGPTLYV